MRPVPTARVCSHYIVGLLDKHASSQPHSVSGSWHIFVSVEWNIHLFESPGFYGLSAEKPGRGREGDKVPGSRHGDVSSLPVISIYNPVFASFSTADEPSIKWFGSAARQLQL
jgi:hypothetical protein